MNSVLVSQPAPDLLATLTSRGIFSSLDNQSLLELIPELEQYHLEPGEVLVRAGEPGDRMFLLVSGSLQIVESGAGEAAQPPVVLQPGESVGELSLITGEPRTETVVARESSTLLSLSRAGLSRTAARSPAAEAQILASLQNNFYTAQLNLLLDESNIFGNLNQDLLCSLRAEFTFHSLKGGQVLMQQGDPSDSLYLVISGRLGVFINDPDGEKKILIELGRGQTVGEMGLITQEPRSAGVYAMRDSLLARLSRESFERLLAQHPLEIMQHFAGSSIMRLNNQIQGRVPPKKVALSIAVLPTHPGIPVKEFSAHLAQALTTIGQTQSINSQTCDERLGWNGIAQASAEDPANNRLLLWLSEQEATHQYVIFESDPTYTHWTQRCLRHADHILILSMQGAPQAGPQEWQQPERLHLPELDGTPASLVLLYGEADSRPYGTQSALEKHGLKNHFKVRLNHSSDYSRLARLLTGKGIGLVLSGGGARSLTQVGVWRALVEAGFEVDAVAGVSAGAVNAALIAMDLDPREIVRRLKAEVRPVDYTFPIHSLVAGKSWTAGLQSILGDWQVEDLWLDYFCNSANLTRSSMVIHRSGSLFQAVRASSAIPGILPPVAYEGDILVDGGLINNFPVDLMRADPRIGSIIGIDVSFINDRNNPVSFGYSVSGWQSLLARFLPFIEKPPVPSIVEILSESMTISKTQSQSSNRSLVDLYFSPPTQGFSMMDFDKVEAITEAGYQYGRKEIAARQAASI